jgi:hypothetical protein
MIEQISLPCGRPAYIAIEREAHCEARAAHEFWSSTSRKY